MGIDLYFVIAMFGQILGGIAMAVGLIIGLRLALPSLARTLARELEAARLVREEESDTREADERGRPVVTLERRDELKN